MRTRVRGGRGEVPARRAAAERAKGRPPIDPAATYRVATNSFLAGGGDGFPTLGQGTNDLVGSDDLAALGKYLTANSSATNPLTSPQADRITIIR